MKLPKIDKPLFELVVPSIGKSLKFRPFTVREEKILLVAQQSGEEKDIILAIKQVVNNCCQDPQFNIDDLATFDLEFLFLKLRSRSINNIINVTYRDNEDDKTYDFEIDLDKVEMLFFDPKANIIKITDEMGMKMKYPSITVIDDTPQDATQAGIVEYLIIKCIDCIYDNENVYPASDYSKEELEDWLNDLDVEAFDNIRKFFDNIPRMYYKIEYKNSLGNDRVIELTTLSDFFTWG